MSKKIDSLYLLLFLLSFPLSSEDCEENQNNCTKCNPITNLCATCDKNILKPDLKGGCEPSHQCRVGENYCIECSDTGELCSKCELGFSPDENGGCSYTNNCLISEDGKCIQCKGDFYLIDSLNFCKYKFSDDFKNCAEINNLTGKCRFCEENFYKNIDDEKCSNTESCRKSTFGICILCDNGFYLDKTDDLCKIGDDEFNNCKTSLDGKICSECNDGFFLAEDGLCTISQNCVKGNKNNSVCIECSEGYFLSKSGICTTEEHCISANQDFGFCEICDDSYYLEIETKKCFSNKEDDKFEFCLEVKSGNCKTCESIYELGKDKKCVLSIKCLESENHICIKCEEGYHLGLDKRCVNIENCIYSNTFGECVQCQDGYYFDPSTNQCLLAVNQYKNCKKSHLYYKYCEICNIDFYFSTPDQMCFSNIDEGPLYKCAVSTDDGTKCSKCVYDYFAGKKDLKCSKIEGCAISENENKCIECDEDYCLDVKKQICIDNYWAPENEEEKIYFNCIKTNDEGTECEVCNDFSVLVNGICVNKKDCAEEENGECIKCNEKTYDNYNMCLNNVYGCVETLNSNCLKCDNINNFDECTECIDGYELNDNGHCVVKSEF